jgi:hypothetical protein
MQWQKKLYYHEEPPPPVIWDEIKTTLAGEPYQLRQSLFDYRETPPEIIWENISSTIENTEKEKIQPLYKTFRRTALSYAAAIVGIGLFISMLVYLLNNKPNQVGVQDLAAGLNFKDSPLNRNDQKEDTQNKNQNPKQSQNNNEGSDKESVTISINSEVLKPGTEPDILKKQNPVTASVSGTAKAIASKNKTKSQVSYSDPNYIVIFNTSGEPSRVSYKLADMVQILQEDTNKSMPASNATRHWNQVISEWKEKLGQSSFIPSGNNFFDIAEMSEMLNSGK